MATYVIPNFKEGVFLRLNHDDLGRVAIHAFAEKAEPASFVLVGGKRFFDVDPPSPLATA